jgi:hypothetical protein
MIFYILISIFYVAFGVGWGFIRWKRFVDSEVEFYESERQRFLNHHHIRGAAIPEFLVFEWRHYVQASVRLREVPPKAHDFQGQVIFDVLFWWLSIIFVVVSQIILVVTRVILSEFNKVTQQKIDRIKHDLH